MLSALDCPYLLVEDLPALLELADASLRLDDEPYVDQERINDAERSFAAADYRIQAFEAEVELRASSMEITVAYIVVEPLGTDLEALLAIASLIAAVAWESWIGQMVLRIAH